MRFSILIPVFNTERYLNACLDSVFRQSMHDFEIVLVNDGSTDDSGVLCDRCRALHPGEVKVVHQPNGGLISARRAGIAAAEGDYCLFLDADDTFTPECLSAVDRCIRATGADIVLFNCSNYFEDTGETRLVPPVFADGSVFSGEGKRAVYRELIAGWRLNNLCLKAVRRTLLVSDDTPYERFFATPYAEDLLQTLYPVTHAERIAYLDQPLYVYRRRSDSLSSEAIPGRIERQFIEPIMEQLRSCMTVWGMDTPEELSLFHSRKLAGLITLFWQHYHAAQTKTARREVLDYPWAQHLTAEDAQYVKANCLPRVKRMQLWAILHKNVFLINLFCTLAKWKGGIRHG